MDGLVEWRSRVCPLPLPSPFSLELLRLHGFYKNRVLPFAGGLYDQPALWVEAMALIEARFAAAARK